MSAGMKYDLKPMEVEKEALRFETVYRLSVTLGLEDDKLVVGSYLPLAAPISVDFATCKVKAVKNVRVAEALTATDTTLKIAKGSLAYVGMFLGDGSKG
ncbi:MAG: head fiber protein, partial [Alistipes sp.]